MKKMFATVTVGLALSLTGVGLSTALASPAGAATPSAASASTTGVPHPLRTWVRSHRKALARHTVQISATSIGISPKSLVSSLRSGKSIAQVAQDNKVDPQTVANALIRAGDTQVGRAVTSHRLTSAQGAKIEAALPKAVDKAVNHVFDAPTG